MSNIGYHTRLFSDNTKKIVGGSFDGAIDRETVTRIVRAHFSVVVKDSGTAVFVDSSQREVTLYLSVDAATTVQGTEALRQWHAERARINEANARRREAEEEEIDLLMSHLSHDEIVRRLKGIPNATEGLT